MYPRGHAVKVCMSSTGITRMTTASLHGHNIMCSIHDGGAFRVSVGFSVSHMQEGLVDLKVKSRGRGHPGCSARLLLYTTLVRPQGVAQKSQGGGIIPRRHASTQT